MPTERSVVRIVWNEGDSIVIHYDDGAASLRHGSRLLASEMAEREGLSSRSAPWGHHEWIREPVA